MSAYIITNSELVAIANAIRNKNSSNETFTLEQIPNAIATIGENIGSGAVVRTATNDKYIINETKLINIANAVRLKNGSNTQYLLSQLPQAILDIVTVKYTVNYYNGSTLLYSEDVSSGNNSSYSGSTPTKASDAQYSYTFAGWSNGTNDNTVDSNALTNITADRNVYACFTNTLRTYTVTFVRASADGGGTLQTLNNVAYGTVLTNSSYTGSTPTTTQGSGSDYAFLGQTPSFTAITGNTTYTAQFDNPIKEITDSWDTIIANIDNGTYSTKYKVGNYKPLDLGSEGIINMQIVGINADIINENENEYAPLTFVAIEALKTLKTFGTQWITSWNDSIIRTYLNNTLYSTIPSNVKNRIQPVVKYYSHGPDNPPAQSSVIDKIWIPSSREIRGDTYYEKNGPTYKGQTLYKNDSTRQKYKVASVNKVNWWIRSTEFNINLFINTSGTIGIAGGNQKNLYLIIGFCLGLEPETITDSWQTILSNPNYATDYKIGDTKQIDLGTEGKHLMEIVAFNTDIRADGNGNAGITWISKTVLNSAAQKLVLGSDGTYATSQLRSFLINTVKPLIPSNIRNSIVTVTKYNYNYSSKTYSSEDVWIPGGNEISVVSTVTENDFFYSYFSNIENCIKKDNNGEAVTWWTRNIGRKTANGTSMTIITPTGTTSRGDQANWYRVIIGFCTN